SARAVESHRSAGGDGERRSRGPGARASARRRVRAGFYRALARRAIAAAPASGDDRGNDGSHTARHREEDAWAVVDTDDPRGRARDVVVVDADLVEHVTDA